MIRDAATEALVKVVREAERVAAEKAWDEGHKAGVSDADFSDRGFPDDPDASEHPHPNPYRAHEA